MAKMYERHLAEVRAAHRTNPLYFEICLQCGDDIWTLIRSLRLNTTRLSIPENRVHANSHWNVTSDKQARLWTLGYIKAHAELLLPH